jgi:hypothetical protein
MDIKHNPHMHNDGSSNKTFRIYRRQKVNGKYCFKPVGWMCSNCGAVTQ